MGEHLVWGVIAEAEKGPVLVVRSQTGSQTSLDSLIVVIQSLGWEESSLIRVSFQTDISKLLFDTGLSLSGKNILKMKFFPGQGKVREFSGWPGKFKKDLKSQGKIREL